MTKQNKFSVGEALYTTTEYIDALTTDDENVFRTKGKDFLFFSSIESAEYDAQWLADYNKKNGIRRVKPRILRVKFERVRKGKK